MTIMAKVPAPPASRSTTKARSFGLVTAAAVIYLIFVAVHQGSDNSGTRWLRKHNSFSVFKKQPKRVLLRESQGFHDEVYASFMSSLSSSSKVQTSISLAAPRFNMEQITNLNQWIVPRHTMNETGADEELDKMQAIGLDPAVIIAVTCGEDLQMHPHFYDGVFAQTSAVLYCVVHHADRFQQDGQLYPLIRPWIEARRIRLITLSKHVQDSLAANVGDNIPMGTFPPVFETHSEQQQQQQHQPAKGTDEAYFALQGNIDTERRDYSSVFDSLRRKAAEGIKSATPQLYILGSGSLDDVPHDIVSLVQIKSKLDYPDFYATLADAEALLPSFATDDYYVFKASSSVPASVISGAPLVVSRRLLEAYSYLDVDSVILKSDDESEFDAASRYMSGPPLARSRTAASLLALRRNLIRQNGINLDRWIAGDAL